MFKRVEIWLDQIKILLFDLRWFCGKEILVFGNFFIFQNHFQNFFQIIRALIIKILKNN